jgi:CDP-diacylglycerol--glycerol-3-phosphate 3-phosphatidyltransferase
VLNLSNVLSLSRAGLALAFLILFAMASDFLDGFLARRQGTTSQFGAVLDPIMDKFFVFFAGGVFFIEKKLTAWELSTLLSRDLSLCFFGVYLALVKGWKDYECKAIWWGKISTVAQFLILIALTLNFVVPAYIFFIFVLMAVFAFLELLTGYRKLKVQ